MSRLWLPYQVRDMAAAETFLTKRLGMSIVDWWERDGEVGRVLAFADDPRPGPGPPEGAGWGGPVVELVSSAADRAAPPAIELVSVAAVDAMASRFPAGEVSRQPGRYPRGHYGFEVTMPGGFPLMIWSER
jgi:catechol 2,3-dioxygenase-like lactoylglutathione lyase family enzyme